MTINELEIGQFYKQWNDRKFIKIVDIYIDGSDNRITVENSEGYRYDVTLFYFNSKGYVPINENFKREIRSFEIFDDEN